MEFRNYRLNTDSNNNYNNYHDNNVAFKEQKINFREQKFVPIFGGFIFARSVTVLDGLVYDCYIHEFYLLCSWWRMSKSLQNY